MSKQKTGKNRLDKYYHLAKEHGYRARSAFKLLQLDNKYKFMSNCKSVIDLCAAPGGWLQVCTEKNFDFILGIDLEQIRTIPGVQTIVGDITLESVRKDIRSLIKKVDLVLNDGAPNVGVSWEQDAFKQNELTLHAFKLACEFLVEGGVFITKVFRSKDYFSLLNSFQKVFRRVEATKPISSREESAEIFVCCFDFVPENVQESVYDPEKVFKCSEEENENDKIKVLDFKAFLLSDNLGEDLKKFTKIRCELVHNLIDEDIKCLFNDLKLLGKSDVTRLVRLRRKLLNLIQNGELEIEGVSIISEEKEINLIKPMTDDEKIEEIKKIMEKEAKPKKEKEKKSKTTNYGPIISEPLTNINKRTKKNAFFDDPIFDSVTSRATELKCHEEVDEVSSCSDSLELDEQELEIAAKMKLNEEEFILDTIDRRCIDKSMVPDFIKKEEHIYERRVAKDTKEMEAKRRRKNKAEKITKKILSKKDEEDSEEENLEKKLMRRAFKKTRSKSRIAFSINGRSNIPKGKGRLKFVDKRMRKDLRKEKK